MPKGGVSGITQAQLNAAVQAALESPENYAVIRDANEEAINNTSGGGSGSSLVFPDLVVSGTGPYVVPAGFNAIVRVSCRSGNVFTINGFQSLGSLEKNNVGIFVNTVGFAAPSYTVPSGYIADLRGAFTSGQNGNGNVSINSNSIETLTVNNTNTSTSRDYRLGNGMNMTTSINFGIGLTSKIFGVIERTDTGFHNQTFMIPSQSLNPPNVFPYPQTVIDGGSERVVELYAI